MNLLNLPLGLHENVLESDYHGDRFFDVPTLSRSLASVLLDESPLHCYHAHPRLGGAPAEGDGDAEEETTPAMDFGSLGHKMLLGRGADVAIGEWKTWQTNAAKDFKKAARADGKIPVLRKVYDRGLAMKFGVLQELKRLGLHEQFEAAKPEVVCLFEEAGVKLRCMFDRLLVDGGRGTIFDLKITESAHPKVCERQIQNMKYDLQDRFYTTGLNCSIPEVAGRTRFVFLFVENKAPFVVTPVELDGAFKTNGTSKYSHAFAVWEKCLKLNQWPAYGDQIYQASPKEWALMEEIGRKMPKFKE